MVLFNKKFIAAFILFLVCLSIFSSGIYSIIHAQEYNPMLDPGFPPAVAENQAKNVKDSGTASPGFATKLILKAANGILYALSWFAGKIITFEAAILNWILDPDNFQLASAPIVKSGWDVTRTTVNMFFVLVLLVVAFATILRIETYSLKTVLPRLIIVALLINFSLVIAGAILDFANVMTNFFYQSLTQQNLGSECQNIGCHLQNGLKVTNFFQPNPEAHASFWGNVGNFGSGILMVFAGLLLGTIFLIATIFIFAVLIVLMLIRILYLWILLILAPAAWFFYIIPAWQNQWYKWWSNFFRWAFFAPIAMFFIYLSIVSLSNMKPGSFENINLSSLSQSARETTNPKTNATSNPVEAIFQFAIGSGLILGSLMVANSMSITGAGIATGLGKKMGAGMASWVGRKAQVPTSRWSGKIGETMDKAIGKIPVVRQLSRPFHRYAETGRQYLRQLEEQYKKRSPEYLASLYGKVSEPKKQAIASVLTEKNLLGLLKEEQRDEAIKLAEKTGNKILAKRILNYDPTAANRIGKKFLNSIMGITGATIDDVIKQLKPQDWVNMNDKAFSNASVLTQAMKYGRGAHIAAVGSAGDIKKLNEIQKYITATGKIGLTAINPEMAKYISRQAGQFGLHF